MKKGLIGFLAMSTLFSLAVVGNSNKVEAALDGFTLVTSASNLVIGNTYYISDVAETYVISTTQKNNNRAAVKFDDNNKGNFQAITLGQGNTSGTCEHCKSKLINKTYNWVMSKKEKIDQK